MASQKHLSAVLKALRFHDRSTQELEAIPEKAWPTLLDAMDRAHLTLALGARCCLIARPQLWGLAVAGEAGVAHVLDVLRGEIDRVMGLMGVRRIADLGPDHLFRDANGM